MREAHKPGISGDVLTGDVWDAIKDIPGVHDLYRDPLRSLGERVHVQWRGPVRMEHAPEAAVLEIHIVLDEGASAGGVGEAVARAGAACLEKTMGTPVTHVKVVVADVAAAVTQ